MLEKVKVTSTEIDELVSVIKEVWPEAFVPIIGQAQVDYMLATYQSKQQIEKEVAEGVQYFLLKEQVHSSLPYSSFSDNRFELHRKYIPCS